MKKLTYRGLIRKMIDRKCNYYLGYWAKYISNKLNKHFTTNDIIWALRAMQRDLQLVFAHKHNKIIGFTINRGI
jgi:hypothetical protein